MGKIDLYRAGNYRPFQRLRFAIKLAFTCAATIATALEIRDNRARKTWKVVPVKEYQTGDILLISNRWYNMPTYSTLLYSYCSKTAMKTPFDETGVVIVDKDKVPHILCVEYDKLVYAPLQEYLESRRPRGVAIRQIEWTKPEVRPTLEVAEAFIAEVRKLTPEPWYMFSAAHRSTREMRYYNLAVDQARSMAVLEKKKRNNDISPAGIAKMLERHKNTGIMLQAWSQEKDFPHFSDFKLFNGSLVGSFLATFDLLDRDLPAPTRYVPADFLDMLPLKHGSTYGAPFIIFKT